MDTIMEDDSSIDSDINSEDSYCTQYEHNVKENPKKRNTNVVNKLFNRQQKISLLTVKLNEDKIENILDYIRVMLYGRFAKNSRASTEKIYEKIPESCKRTLSDVLPTWDTSSAMQHIYMGFTICGQYLLSYTWTTEENLQSLQMFNVKYYLYVWKYAPGHRLSLVIKQIIFRHYGIQELLDVTFSQWPTDRNKVVAYGVNSTHPADAYITVLFLPTLQNCDQCSAMSEDDLPDQLPCLKHSVTIDFMLSITTPFPVYNPVLNLAYPDHIVINTGHYLHIINVTSIQPDPENFTLEKDQDILKYDMKGFEVKCSPNHSILFSDSVSEISDPPSEAEFPITKNNIVDAIIQDFSEYDLENSECAKPFHELNISCEPLNVTGKNYFNTDSKLKIFQNPSIKDTFHNNILLSPQSSTQKTLEKSKIDKKIAEKAYEFTEETEKCEKLSSFRKKRLADKKYEFSEDNSENIVPFQLLRQERRFLLRSQNRCIRSPDFFISPKTGIRSPRSPILSPNNRSGQSCSSPRNIYCPTLRLSPGTCRSPISPRDGRKYSVYSPSHIDSDCSDDSRLILRQNSHGLVRMSNENYDKSFGNTGLLIIGAKRVEEKPRWIRKVVKRYCNLDFESASLVSDIQSRDEYLCIELPTLVYTANNNQIDAAPSRISDELIGPHLKVTQKTFDSEQFCQRRAESLCSENRLKFTHFDDYDIKIQHICPLSGDIVCTAEIKFGAKKEQVTGIEVSHIYITNCMFIWNICTDSYKVMESSLESRLILAKPRQCCTQSLLLERLPQINCKRVRFMSHNLEKSLQYLRDTENFIQISMDDTDNSYSNIFSLIEEDESSFEFTDSDDSF